MLASFKRQWKRSPVVTTILVIAIGASVFFATRMVAFWIYWQDPAHHEQQIAPWMTPGYIGHSWRVPKEVVLEAMNAPEPPPPGVHNLAEIAAYLGVSQDDLIASTERGIDAFRSQHDQPERPVP